MNAAHSIIATLCLHVTQLSPRQMSAGWNLSIRHAERMSDALAGEGLLHRRRVLTPPLLPLERPLKVYRPNEGAPDCGHLSYLARSRWQTQSASTWVYGATSRAADFFGGFASTPSETLKARHELHMSEIFLRFRDKRPGIEERWFRGDVASRLGLVPGNRIADAYILCDCGNVEWAIEFAGAYSSTRLRSFHEFCEQRGYAYQLW
jgi:hypothetical protein